MNGVSTYRETAITTQSKGKLIVMLYDGATRFLRQAIHDIELNDFAGKGRNIAKAQDIILELNTVLDMESGGELAQNLRGLYNFMNRHLSQANVRKDVNMIREIITLLEELNQSWRAITN